MKNLDHKNWIISTERYGGKTKKCKDNNGNWEYETQIKDNANQLIANINEYYMMIPDQNQNWTKRTTFVNGIISFEIFWIKDNNLYKIIKNYENIEYLTKAIPNIILDSNSEALNLTQKSKIRFSTSLQWKTINSLNQIEKLRKIIKFMNQQLINFNENPNSVDFNVLLKLYKYLTLFQKMIDNPKSSVDTSINATVNKLLPNLILGTSLIITSFIGKNIQRIVWVYSFDKQAHTWQDYSYEIFFNNENHLTTIIDTLLTTFFISTTANWSRNVIWDIIQNLICCNKSKKNNNSKIKEIPIEPFIKYKNEFEALLYEENEQKLKQNMAKMNRIASLAKKFNDIESSPEFEYHPNMIKEVANITKLNQAQSENLQIDDTKIKELILTINNKIDSLTKLKKSILKPLSWKNRICYCLNDLGLELVTWMIAHPIMAGVIANTTQEKFTIGDLPEYIFKPNIIFGNMFAYLAMRPINYIFKLGLETMNVSTNICPKIISNWIEEETKYIKFSMATVLFFLVATFTNITKTEASLITKFGLKESYHLLNLKLKKEVTWIFFMLTTASQMFAFSIANSYKIFNFETLLKKIKYFYQPDISLLEEKLITLEKNSNLPIFTTQERLTIEDNIVESKMGHKNQQNFKTNKFNATLINDSESQPFINRSSIIRETKLTLLV